MIELMTDQGAYFYGLLLTDGNCYLQSKNRGRISLEVTDQDIIEKISKIYNGNVSHRIRNTNFKDNLNVYSWRNSKIEFRNELFSYGFPNGNKQYLQNIPNTDFNQKGFWRGVIDGNGSLGITSQGFPFLSLTTKSELLKIAYLTFLYNEFKIKKYLLRNQRDNIYNICVYKEDAQDISGFLYDNSTIFIQRKYDKYLLIKKWVRPTNMPTRQWLSSHSI